MLLQHSKRVHESISGDVRMMILSCLVLFSSYENLCKKHKIKMYGLSRLTSTYLIMMVKHFLEKHICQYKSEQESIIQYPNSISRIIIAIPVFHSFLLISLVRRFISLISMLYQLPSIRIHVSCDLYLRRRLCSLIIMLLVSDRITHHLSLMQRIFFVYLLSTMHNT
jgi:hypothetical protein